MKKIYKYELPVDGNIITIEEHVIKVLSVQAQGGTPMVWAIVDPEVKAIEPMKIIAVGTGRELPTNLGEYLGTAQDVWGYVWHYFEVRENTGQRMSSLAAMAQALGELGTTAVELCNYL